jgi:hypothetical protein
MKKRTKRWPMVRYCRVSDLISSSLRIQTSHGLQLFDKNLSARGRRERPIYKIGDAAVHPQRASELPLFGRRHVAKQGGRAGIPRVPSARQSIEMSLVRFTDFRLSRMSAMMCKRSPR